MAISGLQRTRNAAGGAGRAYAGFTAKVEAEAPVVAIEEATGGWWVQPRRRKVDEAEPAVIAPKRVRRILGQVLRGATERDLAVLREQARNAIAARHAWNDAYDELIDTALREYATGAKGIAPAVSAMMAERALEARRRDDEEAIAVMMMALF